MSHLPRLHREVETNFHVQQKPSVLQQAQLCKLIHEPVGQFALVLGLNPPRHFFLLFCKLSQVIEDNSLVAPTPLRSRKYFSFVTITGQVPRASRDLASPSSCFWFLTAHSIFVAGCPVGCCGFGYKITGSH